MAACRPGMFLHWVFLATLAAGLREEGNENSIVARQSELVAFTLEDEASNVAWQSELVAGTLEDVDECLALKRTDSKCFYRNLCDRPLSFTMPGFKQPLRKQEQGQYHGPYSCDQYPVEAFERYHAYELDKWQKQKKCWKTESVSVFGSTSCFAQNSCDFKLQVACNDKTVDATAKYQGKVDDFYCSCKEAPEPVKTFPKKWTTKDEAKNHCFGVKKQGDQCLARNFCNESIKIDGNFKPFEANWRGKLTTPSVCDRFSQKAFDVYLEHDQKQWEADVQKWQTQQKCFHSMKTVNKKCVVSNKCAGDSITVLCSNCNKTLSLKAQNDYFASDTCFCDCDRPKPSKP